MAEQPASAATSGGFKLKLKLGGSGASASTSTSSIGDVNRTGQAGPSASASTSATMPSVTTPSAAIATLLNTAAATADAPGDTSMGDASGYYEHTHDSAEDDGDDFHADDGEFRVESNAGASSSKKSKASSKKKSATPGILPPSLASGSATPSSSTLPSMEPRYDTSIGSIVVPATGTPTNTAPKRKKGPTVNPGAGRGWRKGVKGYIKPEDGSMPPVSGALYSPAAVAGGSTTAASTPPLETTRRRKANISMAEDPLDDDYDDEFIPTILPPGAIVTSDKWQNGLPGGNEQSRQTAAMAAAVNKLYPVGPPPKTGSGFLPNLPLDKNTPRPRSWKKAKREMLGPGGVPFYLPVWVGDNESPYAEHMVHNPRPPPIDKRALAALSAANSGGDGSPFPEGTSDGRPGTPLLDGTSAAITSAAPAPKRRKRLPGEPKRKPGPPKKIKVAPGTAAPSTSLTNMESYTPVQLSPAVLPAQPSPAVPAPIPAFGAQQMQPTSQSPASNVTQMGHFG